MSSKMLLSNFAAVCSVFSLTLAVLGFATDHWIDFQVNKSHSGLQSNKTLIDKFGLGDDRNRGLLKECYLGVVTYLSDRKQSNSCAWIEYEIPQKQSFREGSSDYKIRIHLIRFSAVSLALSMFLLFVGFVCHVTSTCCDIQQYSSALAGIACVFSFLLQSATFAAFMVAFYVYEKERVKDSWYFWAAWSEALKEATSFRLGWSLWVFVASIPFSLLSAILFFVAHRAPESSDEGKQPLHSLHEPSFQFEEAGRHQVEMHERDSRSQVSSTSGMGRIMKQQIYKNTIDPVTGRELSARINDGYSDDNMSYNGNRHGDRYGNRYDDRNYYSQRPDRHPQREERQYESRMPQSGESGYPPEPQRDYNSPRQERGQRDYRRYESGRDQYF